MSLDVPALAVRVPALAVRVPALAVRVPALAVRGRLSAAAAIVGRMPEGKRRSEQYETGQYETQQHDTRQQQTESGRASDDTSVRDEWVAVADGVRLHLRRWSPPGSSGVDSPIDGRAADVGDVSPAVRPTRDFLLVHGLSSNARLWDEVAARLAGAGHAATAIDLRSHGESDTPDDGYDTATAADDVASIAATLGIKGAVIAGQSWGGNVVLRLAAEHPDVAAALALVDGGWFSPSDEFHSWELAERRMRPPDVDGRTAEQMRAVMRAAHPQWSDSAIYATVANLAVEPDGTIRRRLTIAHHMQIARSMYDDPPLPYYPRISVPVLLMPALPADTKAAGARRARLERAAAGLAHASISEYVGGDHDLHAQQPDRVAKDLLALADRLDGSGALGDGTL